MGKKSLTIEEQLIYLRNVKNISIDNEDECLMYLSKIGYINFISPYKHYFHEGKYNGKHIYPNLINISEYYKAYNKDRQLTISIRENVFDYEKLIKTHIADSISKMYNELQTTEELKHKIIEELELIILKLDSNKNQDKVRIKIQYLEKLRKKFSDDSEYYLIMNKLEFGALRSFKDLIPNSYRSTELKYFFENGDTLRIIRNNISHSSYIQIYLNNLNLSLFRRNINALKRLEQVLLNPSEVNYTYLQISHSKYNKSHIDK